MIVRGRRVDRRPAKRGSVSDFSANSRRNLAWAYSQGPWVGMLTLTYPGAEAISKDETKSHLNAFLQHLRRHDIRYLWILEFQRRGQIHYHVWVSRPLIETTDTVTGDKIRRCFPWRSLMISWLRIIGESDNPKARAVALHPASYCPWTVRVGNNYAAKYAEKRSQKGLPTGIDTVGRWWSRSRGMSEPNYMLHMDESTETVKTESVQFRRQFHKYLCRQFPARQKLYWTPRQGIRVALNEDHMRQLQRLLLYYLGPDLETAHTCTPDTPSYAFRAAMSRHRLV